MTGLERLPKTITEEPGCKYFLDKIGDRFLEHEHYRLYDDGVMTVEYKGREAHLPLGEARGNLAVVVLKDGRCYIGKAVCAQADQYVKKKGYRLAVKRALEKAARSLGHQSCSTWAPCVAGEDFQVPAGVGGVELRDLCRVKLGL